MTMAKFVTSGLMGAASFYLNNTKYIYSVTTINQLLVLMDLLLSAHLSNNVVVLFIYIHL